MFTRNSTRTHLIALCAIGLAVPAAAQGSDPQYYLGAQAGTHDLSSWNADVRLGAGVGVEGRADTDKGRQAGLIVGRQTEHARYELEYQRGTFDLTGIQLGPVVQPASGGGDYQALTFNAYRTVTFRDNLRGFLGAGVGWGRVSMPQAGFDNGCNCFSGASRNGFAYLGRVGAEYQFADDQNIFFQYTLLRLRGPESDSVPGISYSRKSIGIFGLGYRHVF